MSDMDDRRMLQEIQVRLELYKIPRWTIVDMRRKQSVAEHSFQVALLAISLYDFMQYPVPHNSFDRESAFMWALDHDMDEIRSGDIPAPIKIEVERLAPGVLDQAVENMMSSSLPTYLTRKRGVKNSYPYDLVKIADKVEEVRYNNEHGYDEKADAALVDGLRLLGERFRAARGRHPRYDWDRAATWVDHLLRPVLRYEMTRQMRPTINELLDL